MKQLFESLRKEVAKLSSNSNFIHHKWFIKWHLEIVEKISLELCDKYPEADKDLVLGLVWTHDYAKVIDFDNEHNPETIEKVDPFLTALGFESNYTKELISLINIFESKMTEDLNDAPIEVKIVSSADAASHMVGPFFAIHWYENPQENIADLLESKNWKLQKDWERKVVLPEVKEAFLDRYKFHQETAGKIPNSFLNN